jgi:hypothetical protein
MRKPDDFAENGEIRVSQILVNIYTCSIYNTLTLNGFVNIFERWKAHFLV